MKYTPAGHKSVLHELYRSGIFELRIFLCSQFPIDFVIWTDFGIEVPKISQICENVSFKSIFISGCVLPRKLIIVLLDENIYFTEHFGWPFPIFYLEHENVGTFQIFVSLLETLKYSNFRIFFRGLCSFNFNKQYVIWKLIKFIRFSPQIWSLKCF